MQKSPAHQALIAEAKAVGVICPDRFRSQKALRAEIARTKRANERDEARAEVSRRVMPI